MFAEMRYLLSMAMLVPILAAAMAGALVSNTPATRFDSGAAVAVAVRAQIIRTSASVGAGLAPPAPGMSPRRTIVTAADGRLVPALVYDFE